jgi:hypothetical protein
LKKHLLTKAKNQQTKRHLKKIKHKSKKNLPHHRFIPDSGGR